jgi:hypothetical protein
MTTFAFPTLSRSKPSEWRFGLRSNTLVHVSPLSGQMQTVELPGARWFFAARWLNLLDADRAVFEVFLMKLRGQANRFTVHDFSRPVPLGTMRGSPVTSGSIAAGAVSFNINAGGGQAGTTLLAGDKLNVGGELKMVVDPLVTLNGSGIGAVGIEPPFRSAIGGGAAVAWDRPTAVFVATEPEWSAEINAPSLALFGLDAMESFA